MRYSSRFVVRVGRCGDAAENGVVAADADRAGACPDLVDDPRVDGVAARQGRASSVENAIEDEARRPGRHRRRGERLVHPVERLVGRIDESALGEDDAQVPVVGTPLGAERTAVAVEVEPDAAAVRPVGDPEGAALDEAAVRAGEKHVGDVVDRRSAVVLRRAEVPPVVDDVVADVVDALPVVADAGVPVRVVREQAVVDAEVDLRVVPREQAHRVRPLRVTRHRTLGDEAPLEGHRLDPVPGVDVLVDRPLERDVVEEDVVDRRPAVAVDRRAVLVPV
ncbi:MAG: hypothetical protein MUF27_15100, partial [Acidobacteria bacterium]|nr:hypothetical protein [Acidobacteriota bacterium]